MQLTTTLPKSLKLLNAQAYQRVFGSAKRFGNRYFTLFVSPNDLVLPRLGITVAKKNVRKSVKRNTIKRVVRESFRLHQHGLQNFDVIVATKSTASDLSKLQLKGAVEELWIELAKFYKLSALA